MRSSTPASDFLSAEAAAVPLGTRAGNGVFKLGRTIRKYPFPAATAAFLLMMAAVAVLAPVIAGDPNTVEPLIRLEAPSAEHVFGTDALGRDVFDRVAFGTRITLLISVASVAMASVFSVGLGLVSGYKGGWFDSIIQRFVDVLLSFPGLFVIISLASIVPGGLFGSNTALLIVTIAIVLLGAGTRVARGATLQVVSLPYVEAAESMGANTRRIIMKHILPNILAPVMVVATAQLGIAILLEATASFLGFGVQPPTPSLGFMLGSEARVHMTEQLWLSIWPGLAIFLTVFSFNILGDTMRDVFDPRLRGS